MLFLIWKYSHATPKKMFFESPLSFPVRFPSPLWGAPATSTWPLNHQCFRFGVLRLVDMNRGISSERKFMRFTKQAMYFFCTVMFKGVKVLSSFEWFKWLGMMCLIVNMVFEKLHFSRQIHSKPGLCLKTCLRYLLDSGWAWGLFSV